LASRLTLDVDAAGVDGQKARELIHAADRRCPYSNAIRGNVGVKLLLGGRPLVPAA
jgi:organic hydroperoxide reductase OsmC/OhrA